MSRRAARRAFAAERQEWDATWAVLGPARAGQDATVLSLVRALLCFFNPSKDQPRLAALAPYLLSPTPGSLLPLYHRQRLAAVALADVARADDVAGALVVALLSSSGVSDSGAAPRLSPPYAHGSRARPCPPAAYVGAERACTYDVAGPFLATGAPCRRVAGSATRPPTGSWLS